MPAKFDRCVKAVKRRGGVRNAYAICTAAGARNPKKRRKRTRKGKRTVTTTTSRVVRVINPRPAFVIITAERGSSRLRYDGRNFSSKRPKLWGASRMREAFTRMHELRRKYASALRGWKLDVKLWQ